MLLFRLVFSARVHGASETCPPHIARLEGRQIALLVNQIVGGVFEGAGQDLTGEGDRQERGLRGAVRFGPGHPHLPERVSGLRGSSHRTEAQFITVGRLFLQTQRQASGATGSGSAEDAVRRHLYAVVRPFCRVLL